MILKMYNSEIRLERKVIPAGINTNQRITRHELEAVGSVIKRQMAYHGTHLSEYRDGWR
jgi:hypothetical protein